METLVLRIGLCVVLLAAYAASVSAIRAQSAIPVSITVGPEAGRTPISPYIYGTNQDLPGVARWTARRLGGNRMTGYNWENNASNAGKDWRHSSDNYMCGVVGVADCDEPGAVLTTFHNQSLAQGAYSILTLQMAGYVAKDKRGTVREDQTTPSGRWVPVVFAKGAPFAYPPDLSDDAVYMDELVAYLVGKYGAASDATGVRAYSLDNEPGLWHETHPRLHPEHVTCAELVARSVSLAQAVKAVDPSAEIYGPALYGFNAYLSLQDAPDWPALKSGYTWFADYYLDQIRQASDAAGVRLLDVFDVHWYSEARGGGKRVVFEGTGTEETRRARVQAPRTLWDPTYTEDSWIAQYFSTYLPLIPTLQASIDAYYPGMKLSFSEWGYGGESDVTGGIAAADVLGIFGKYGIYLAAHWSTEQHSDYIAAAYNLYRNYDGAGGVYGDTAVQTETSDIENTSVYGSVFAQDDGTLHLIVMNKNFASPVEATFTIAGDTQYRSAQVWGFDESSPEIVAAAPTTVEGNEFTYTIPPLTVYHIVLSIQASSQPTATPEPTAPPTPTVSPSAVSPTATVRPTVAPAPEPHKPAWATPVVYVLGLLIVVGMITMGLIFLRRRR